jgi:hypothetical protein
MLATIFCTFPANSFPAHSLGFSRLRSARAAWSATDWDFVDFLWAVESTDLSLAADSQRDPQGLLHFGFASSPDTCRTPVGAASGV